MLTSKGSPLKRTKALIQEPPPPLCSCSFMIRNFKALTGIPGEVVHSSKDSTSNGLVSTTRLHFFFYFFSDKISFCIPGWPESKYITDQDELIKIHLPLCLLSAFFPLSSSTPHPQSSETSPVWPQINYVTTDDWSSCPHFRSAGITGVHLIPC